MESPNKKTRLSESHCERETKIDRISDLPLNVIDQILSCLSIRESAQTSLLSTEWRHRWESVPSLVFDDRTFSFDTVDSLVADINRILLRHVGPVDKFELSLREDLPSKEIDSWILYLSRRSVKDLVLKISRLVCYSVPNCLFSCHSLRSLEISDCVLERAPSSFVGFKSLTSLTLTGVTVPGTLLENLISRSPVLENLDLDLDFLYGAELLDINAPNLRSFKFKGPICEVSLENCPRLDVLSIITTTTTVRDINYKNRRIGNDSNLLNLLANMHQLGSLTVGGYYFMYLAKGATPNELPMCYPNLTFLRVVVNFSILNEISAFLCLLRSFPNLQELHIKCSEATSETISRDIRDVNDLNFPLPCLRHVEMSHFCGAKDEIEFVKFVLLNSPVLERVMVVERMSDDNECNAEYYKRNFEILKQIVGFKRASTEAEVTFLEQRSLYELIRQHLRQWTTGSGDFHLP